MPRKGQKLKSIACTAIDTTADKLGKLSVDIHVRPELGFQEHFASERLKTFFEGQNFSVTKPYGGLETAFCAVMDKPSLGEGGQGKEGGGRGGEVRGCGSVLTVAILCEYDALPEMGHACGHNLIAEVGAGAAVGIKAAIEAGSSPEDKLGILQVIGTPAEEGGGGKIRLITAGAFRDVDFAMMCHPHNMMLIDPRDNILCVQYVNVSYKGLASHAADAWKGINALDAAILAFNNISAMRQQMKSTWKAHGVITNGGKKANIIPGETEIEFGIRAPTKAELDTLRTKVHKCFTAAAEATGCEATVSWSPITYMNILSNKTLTKTFVSNSESLGIDVAYDPRQADIRGSTDMGNVSYEVPSIHPGFDIGTEASNHTPEFAVDAGHPRTQPHVLNQAKALAMTAIDIFINDTLAAQMRVDFEEDLKLAGEVQKNLRKGTTILYERTGN